MIRTGEQYRDGLRDGREVWIDGERVKDVDHAIPPLKPIVDIRARMYDMQHEDAHASTLTYVEDNKRHSIFNRLPREQKDWHDKWARRRRRDERHRRRRHPRRRRDRRRDVVALSTAATC